MTSQSDIAFTIEQLQEYIELDGTEWGEMLQLSTQLWGYQDYFGERLRKALEAELSSQLKWAQKNLDIVETEETITRTSRTLEQKQ